ncbi:MAG: leucine-rich repeat protein, partial [Clostridia bacterium]|nr:leucine-rich repeat protein [Clostridia bacterium]
ALTNINIPPALTTIGNSAFENCTVLAMEMDLSNVTKIGTKAFISAGITKVVLGDSITVISAELFSNCSNLSEISIPDGLTEIGDYAFSKCPSLKSVNIPDSTKSIGTYAFWMSGLETLTGGNGITAIGNAAFSHTSITEAYIPASVGTVSMNVFYGCKNLKKVVIEDGITCIGGGAFYECTSLTDINLPDSITVIDYSAFYKCSSLKKIELPKNLTKIGREAFSLATGLTELTLPGTLGDEIGTEAFYCCSGIKSLVIGEGITKITKNMFYRCTGIESIVIPSTVTEIEAESFYACYNFKNVIIAEGFNSNLPENFKSCSHLAQIYIPTSLEKDLVFPVNTIILVEKDSFAHNYAMENNMLYFVIQRGGNPDIAYGKGISGTVSLSGGSVVAGATVEISYDNGTLKETDTTDGNGTYSFTYAEVGSYTITATDANGNTAMTKVSVKRMNVFDVILEGDTNLKLKTAWSISGTVSEDTATVTLTDLDGNVINSLETNDGTFIITNVSNGTYIIKAETERSGIVREIHVFDGNLEGISLTLPEVATTGTIYGYAFVESRDKTHQSKRNWVNITVYNSDGIAIDSCKSDKNGWYMFTNLPLGEYNVVARVSEMRPDKNHKFDRNFELTGYAYVNIAEATEYQADIILREEHETKKSLSGKVTANGEHQACTVILSDVFGNEIASVTTSKNGKYVFANITDGAYFITAHTESDGSGFTFVMVINGRIFGNTDIRVQKDSHIVNRENNFKNEVPDFKDRDECRSYKDRIAQEKRFYDGLSNKEKKQLSSEYVERLNRYVEWLAEIEYATNDSDVRIENGGMAVSKDELENDKQITFCLNVEKKNGHNASTDGINNEDDYKHHAMKDAAGKKEIKQYYDISLSKNVDGQEIPIESVCKDTNSSGKFRIVITIPEDHRGYKHYSLLHDHHGEIVTLADLDDDPNTITVEIDRFSTFALTATDEDLFITDPAEELYFKGASLTIQNNLNINYKIDKAHFDSIGFTDPYVVFNMKGVETVVSEYTDDGESYIFTFDNIAPHLMNETITATLYATLAGDEYSSSVHEYSIVTYAMNMLIRYAGDGSYEKLCTLLADMLIYGEMSQKYVGYKLDELATNQLTEEYLSFATSTLPEAVSVLDTEYTVTENATVKITGAGLNLEDNVKLRFTLSAASADGLEVRITTDSGNSWVIDSEDFVRSGNAYLVYLDELSMGQLREKVYVTVYSGDVAVSNTVRYSIESYAANKLEGDGSALSDLLVAMMKYGDSATAFKEN